MKKIRFALCLLIVAICVTACAAPPTVRSFNDPRQSFKHYQSFAWISDNPMLVSGDRMPEPLVVQTLQNAIVNTLETKGYEFIDNPDAADFVVFFAVGARDRLEIREYGAKAYFGPHWRWGQDSFDENKSRGFQTVREYSVGNLSIDIFDVKRKSPVWHGSAVKELTYGELHGDSIDSTKAAVRTLLSSFPPQ